LFQTICHALGYTVTKSGISDVYLSVSYGRVAPKKEKKGIFEWVSNFFLFVGPFFIPAFLLLVCLYFLMTSGFEISIPAHLIDMKYTFAEQITTFGTSLYAFVEGFYNFLFNIDLLHPGHFGFLIFLIFLGMGIRPSYIGEKKLEKVDMFYDLRNIWSLIIHKPLYVIILFLMAYVFFYISLFLDQSWYVAFFSLLGWLSIISITALVIADVILYLIKTTDEIPGRWKILPYISFPISYVLIRLVFLYFPTDYVNIISLFFMILFVILVTFLLLKYKTNKFKTRLNIKLRKKKTKGEKDGRRRDVEE
jgi:hypothetical protein